MEFSDDLIAFFESDFGKQFELPKRQLRITADDRLASSFHQITEFVEKNDRLPDLDSPDISEASLAARLNSIRIDHKKTEQLQPIDSLGLLETPKAPETLDELFVADPFGLFKGAENNVQDISKLPERRQVENEADEVAKRVPAKDFQEYRSMFAATQSALSEGSKKLTPFTTIDQLKVDNFYVNAGQMVYVAEEGKIEKKAGYSQQRLRVIIENGTESNMYRRSLAQRLYEGGFAVVDKDYVGETKLETTDKIAGYVYILKSKSTDEKITTISNLYKIGFTTTTIADRIVDAEKDPTYLMAPVEVVDSFIITGDYNPQKVEHFIHRIFASCKLDLRIIDSEGREVIPSEWYSVPLVAIEQAVNMLQNGEIVNYVYNSEKNSFVDQ